MSSSKFTFRHTMCEMPMGQLCTDVQQTLEKQLWSHKKGSYILLLLSRVVVKRMDFETDSFDTATQGLGDHGQMT